MFLKYYHKYYFIYLTKNIINNKCYIGWHATNKINDSYIGSGRLLKRSINKYGEKSHITGIIEFCNKTNVLEKEIYWIKKNNTIAPNGYNLTKGGDGGNTYILLSEERKKIFRDKSSKNHKGKIVSKETRDKISLIHLGNSYTKGIKKSEEHKQNLKKAWKIRRIEKPMTEETKEKHRQNSLGKKHSEEAKKKIGIANSKRIWKEESKNKISKKNKGLKRTEETKEKMRKKYECIYCGKEMNKSNLTRYHNNNCNKSS